MPDTPVSPRLPGPARRGWPWFAVVMWLAGGLLLAFIVLRPLMKNLTRAPRFAGQLAGDRVSLSGGGPGSIKLAPSFEAQLAAARTLVGQDPRRAAQVVKDWVADG